MSSGGVDIFDSNVWALGLAQAQPDAEQLVKEAKNGTRDVVLNAYLFEEVFQVFQQSYPQQANSLQTAFSQLARNRPNIDCPPHQAVSQMHLQSERDKVKHRFVGEILGVQPKDTPIVYLARRQRLSNPTIHTFDKPFANFNPGQFGLSWLSMKFVP